MQQLATLIQLGDIELAAGISVPERARGLVLFAHGSGSSRQSSRNRYVAQSPEPRHDDRLVLALNRSAMSQLPQQGDHRLEIIPGATHLFEEPGALDAVAALARDWFLERLK